MANAMLPATEALTITNNALATGPETTAILRSISEQIRAEAKEGKRLLHYPFHKEQRPISPEIKAAVRRMVEAAGYRWEHKPAQDPGDPRDCPLDTICW